MITSSAQHELLVHMTAHVLMVSVSLPPLALLLSVSVEVNTVQLRVNFACTPDPSCQVRTVWGLDDCMLKKLRQEQTKNRTC